MKVGHLLIIVFLFCSFAALKFSVIGAIIFALAAIVAAVGFSIEMYHINKIKTKGTRR